MVLGLPLELWHSKDALGQGWAFEREVKHRRSLYSCVLIIVLDLSILGSADVRVPHGVYFCGVGVLDGVFRLPHPGLASGSGFRGVRAPFSDPRVSLEFVC